jgi:hypothetical protein
MHSILYISSGVIDAYKYIKSCYTISLKWFYKRYFDGHIIKISHIDLQNHTCKQIYNIFRPLMLPRFVMFRTLPWQIYNYGLIGNDNILNTNGLYECILCHNGTLMITLFHPQDVKTWLDPVVTTIIDHERASCAILSALTERHRVMPFVAHVEGVDVTAILESIVGQDLTATELYNYMVTKHGLVVQSNEVCIDIMDMDTLEQTSYKNDDKVLLKH